MDEVTYEDLFNLNNKVEITIDVDKAEMQKINDDNVYAGQFDSIKPETYHLAKKFTLVLHNGNKEFKWELENKLPEYNPFKSNKRQTSFHFDDGPNQSFSLDEPIRQDFSQAVNDVDEWQVGDIVIHTKLGEGVVIELEGDDIIKVNFKEHGIKSIMGNHPSVSKGGHKA